MTDNKLTLADCFKYPNAKVKTRNNIVSNIYSLIIFNGEMSIEYVLNVYDCKLILRDIGNLTNEEKKHILNSFVFELFNDSAGESNWDSFNELFAICENKMGLIDYLRSINIDIDRFIASGKAVKDV